MRCQSAKQLDANTQGTQVDLVRAYICWCKQAQFFFHDLALWGDRALFQVRRRLGSSSNFAGMRQLYMIYHIVAMVIRFGHLTTFEALGGEPIPILIYNSRSDL